MARQLPVPAELMHLIEKRETEERRIEERRKDDVTAAARNQAGKESANVDRRSGKDRRANKDRRQQP